MLVVLAIVSLCSWLSATITYFVQGKDILFIKIAVISFIIFIITCCISCLESSTVYIKPERINIISVATNYSIVVVYAENKIYTSNFYITNNPIKEEGIALEIKNYLSGISQTNIYYRGW